MSQITLNIFQSMDLDHVNKAANDQENNNDCSLTAIYLSDDGFQTILEFNDIFGTMSPVVISTDLSLSRFKDKVCDGKLAGLGGCSPVIAYRDDPQMQYVGITLDPDTLENINKACVGQEAIGKLVTSITAPESNFITQIELADGDPPQSPIVLSKDMSVPDGCTLVCQGAASLLNDPDFGDVTVRPVIAYRRS